MRGIRVEVVAAGVELPGQGQDGRPGSCSVRYVRGREAVMPQLFPSIDLAECEDLCILQEVFNADG